MKGISTSLLELNDGNKMPSLGFGTANLDNKNTPAFKAALEYGYRHFDSASMYGNEKELGEVIRQANVSREDLFIVTKLWNSDQGYESTKLAFQESMENLQLEYIDMYMTHWPEPNKRMDSWRAMEELHEQGLIRSLGVSNYTIRHLVELLENSNIIPAVNQVEFSPFLFQKDLWEFCKSKNIILEAYSPILSVVRNRSENAVLNEIALNHSKSIAQVAIKWSLQLGNSVIPRSSNRSRIRENSDVFDFTLTNDEMSQISNLDEKLRLEWDPSDVP